MDPIKAKFYHASIEIEKDGYSLSVKGLVSPSGATKIHFPTSADPFWLTQVGQVVQVQIDGFWLKAVLLQQFIEHGSFYELRFKDLIQPLRDYFWQRISSEGISPGWQRKFPRIPVGNNLDPDLPIPNLCIVRFVGKEIFVNVVNFTLGGIRVQTLTDVLAEVRVGTVLHFDLMASNGLLMPDLSAEIKNLSAHEGENGAVTRSFGLEFREMDPVNEKKYKDLIKEYCLVLQKKLTGE